MPVAPKPGCLVPRCPHRAERRGRCVVHARDVERERRERSGHDLYDKRWRAEAKAFLAEPNHQRCADCGQPSQCVDHREAHKGNAARFWNRANWRPLCLRCNTVKANRQENGFGRGRGAGPN